MGPTQKAVLRRLAARDDKRGTVSDLALESGIPVPVVHAGLAHLVAGGQVERSESGSVKYIAYTLTPLGERMAEELGEG